MISVDSHQQLSGHFEWPLSSQPEDELPCHLGNALGTQHTVVEIHTWTSLT